MNTEKLGNAAEPIEPSAADVLATSLRLTETPACGVLAASLHLLKAHLG